MNDSLRQIDRQYLLSRGEPPLRDDDTIRREAHSFITHGKTLTQKAKLLIEMVELFVTRQIDASIQLDAWDILVRDHSDTPTKIWKLCTACFLVIHGHQKLSTRTSLLW
jgi:hypothetical protein